MKKGLFTIRCVVRAGFGPSTSRASSSNATSAGVHRTASTDSERGRNSANASDSSPIQQTPLQDKHGADRAGEDYVSGVESHDLERHNEQLYALDAQGIESSADRIVQTAVDAEHGNEFWQSEVEEFFADYDSMDSKLVVDLFGDRRLIHHTVTTFVLRQTC